MSELTRVLERARNEQDYNLLLDVLPYARLLGLRAQWRDGSLCVHLPFRANLIGNPFLPALHGGVVGATLEMAALMEIIHQRGGDTVPKTIDFTIDYLRAARAVDLYATAEVQRAGRRVVNVRMLAFQGDDAAAVALGRGHFLLSS